MSDHSLSTLLVGFVFPLYLEITLAFGVSLVVWLLGVSLIHFSNRVTATFDHQGLVDLVGASVCVCVSMCVYCLLL